MEFVGRIKGKNILFPKESKWWNIGLDCQEKLCSSVWLQQGLWVKGHLLLQGTVERPGKGGGNRFFGNRPASVPAVALVPHQKLCVAFPSKPVSWRTESSNHTGSGDDILCVWPFTHNERTPCEHQLLANCNLFAEGWNRRMLLVLWAVCWGRSVCIEMLWKAVAKHSVGLCGRATTALT